MKISKLSKRNAFYPAQFKELCGEEFGKFWEGMLKNGKENYL